MSDLALGALNNSIISSMTKWGSDNTAFGYAGLMMWRDVMLQDMPVYETAYDYFNYGMGTTTFLGDYTIQYDFWNFYYSLIHQCNLLIEAVNVENLSSTGKHYLGNAYAFRAMAYMDCMRLYEFKHTGTELDAKAGGARYHENNGSHRHREHHGGGRAQESAALLSTRCTGRI